MTSIDWPKPWRRVDERRRKYIGGELAWELSHFPEHPLARRAFQVVAMMCQFNNAVIQFDDGTFGYVHLFWRAEPPYFVLIGGEADLVRFLQSCTTAD